MCKESNEDGTKETLQTNKQRALMSLQLVYSCVFTCFRFASTLNMLLCLLLCAFVTSFQSSSMFPYTDFEVLSSEQEDDVPLHRNVSFDSSFFSASRFWVPIANAESLLFGQAIKHIKVEAVFLIGMESVSCLVPLEKRD